MDALMNFLVAEHCQFLGIGMAQNLITHNSPFEISATAFSSELQIYSLLVWVYWIECGGFDTKTESSTGSDTTSKWKSEIIIIFNCLNCFLANSSVPSQLAIIPAVAIATIFAATVTTVMVVIIMLIRRKRMQKVQSTGIGLQDRQTFTGFILAILFACDYIHGSGCDNYADLEKKDAQSAKYRYQTDKYSQGSYLALLFA